MPQVRGLRGFFLRVGNSALRLSGRGTRPTRVLVADDDRFFIEALTAVLGVDERVEVVGRAADGAEALALTEELRPDVVLMDLNMPRLDGIEATRRIHREVPAVPVVILTASSSPVDAERALLAGAAGYLTKDCLGLGLVDAMLEILRELGGPERLWCKFPASAASFRQRALHVGLEPQRSTTRRTLLSHGGGLAPEAASPPPAA